MLFLFLACLTENSAFSPKGAKSYLSKYLHNMKKIKNPMFLSLRSFPGKLNFTGFIHRRSKTKKSGEKVGNLGTMKCHVTFITKEIRQSCYFRPCTVPRLRLDSGLREI
jgi:hypothetical protein